MERRQSLIIPREHGAWGILLVPLFTGAAVGLMAGGNSWRLVPLVITALALFWLRTPLESWIGAAPLRARGPDERNLVRRAVLLLAVAAAAALAWLLWSGPDSGLLGIGAVAGAAFLGQAALRRIRPAARTVAQMVGAAGLTCTAPAAYYTVTGRLQAFAWFLWAANLLFAINQIHFVQLRIHAARSKTRGEKLAAGRPFLAGQCTLILALAVTSLLHLYPWYAGLAFLPILWRGFAWFLTPPRTLVIHALGKSELAYACAFGLLLVLGMGLR